MHLYDRTLIGKQQRIFLFNLSSKHNSFETFFLRVSSYWSYMVIKPYRGFNESGIEFTLTYFDDPGVSLSYAITSWVAMRGI